jgi:hypothetical protein
VVLCAEKSGGETRSEIDARVVDVKARERERERAAASFVLLSL